MQQNEGRIPQGMSSRLTKPLITLIALALAGLLIWSRLPRAAYPSDLSQIGRGHPVLALALDNDYVGGRNVMELMNAIRADYADRVEFLVISLGTPEGRSFALRHNAADGTVLLFARDGSLMRTVDQPRTTDELRRALHETFAL